MKDKDNVLRRLDEADDMARVLSELASKQAVDTNEAVRRLAEIRRRIKFAIDRVTVS
jgi:uncharacterized protein YidB (DUF937 family)